MYPNKWHGELPEFVYHVTSKKMYQHYLEIEDNMIPEGSYWANEYVSEYYQDEYGEGAIIKLPVSLLKGDKATPDYNGFEEPISTFIGMKENEIWELWFDEYTQENGYNSKKNDKGYGSVDETWENSLKIIGSLQIMGRVDLSLCEIEYF